LFQAKEKTDTKVRADPGAALIRLRGVTKSYPMKDGGFEALKSIDADIFPGEFVGILGKSGAGKTTLINLIAGIDHLTEGEIWVNGVPVHTLNEDQAANWRGLNLGVIYQSFALMPTLNLINNVTLGMDFCKTFRGQRSRERGLKLLRQVGLEQHTYKLPSAISGGEQQRVAIARALANDPPIMIADEPTGRLDSATADMIFQIFENLVQQGKTILMVSHDTSFFHRYSRVIWLEDGCLTSEPQFEIAGVDHVV
jgi:putative ABC transport system ATP-binding protein